MEKNEKLKKLDVDATKGISGGTIYWSYDENGRIRLFVAGREYALGPDAVRENFRLGLPHAAVRMNSVDEARRASLRDFANAIEPTSSERGGGLDRDGNVRRI